MRCCAVDTQASKGRVTRVAQNGDICDLNLVMVVKEADEKIWLESNLSDK